MFTNGLQRRGPSLNAVALLALRSHLPAMDVGVTIGASMTDVLENRLGMALRAGHALVHPAQRIPGLVVIELGNVADRLPS